MCVFLYSCSTEKNAFLNRSYHYTTVKYNGYFNGNESYKLAKKNIEIAHKDDFDKLLDVFKYGNFTDNKKKDILFSKFPDNIKSLQWHSYEVQGVDKNPDITLIASSPITKYQIFKYQDHAYGIQFHIEIKDTTVNEWGCVPEYKKALEDQLGDGALEKFDQSAKKNMKDMNNYSKILYDNFKSIL